MLPDHNVFSVNPISLQVNKGANATFTCTFSDEVCISWNGPGVMAGNITGCVKNGANTSTLTIVNVNGSHAGEYFCTVQFSENGNMMMFNSTKANLTVNCKYIIIMQSYRK